MYISVAARQLNKNRGATPATLWENFLEKSPNYIEALIRRSHLTFAQLIIILSLNLLRLIKLISTWFWVNLSGHQKENSRNSYLDTSRFSAVFAKWTHSAANFVVQNSFGCRLASNTDLQISVNTIVVVVVVVVVDILVGLEARGRTSCSNMDGGDENCLIINTNVVILIYFGH